MVDDSGLLVAGERSRQFSKIVRDNLPRKNYQYVMKQLKSVFEESAAMEKSQWCKPSDLVDPFPSIVDSAKCFKRSSGETVHVGHVYGVSWMEKSKTNLLSGV
jgi:hypothetical protein